MSKQTAVEWYEKEKTALLIKLENQKITLGEFAVKNVDLFQQAKQMEREQIIKAFNEGTFSEMEKIDAEDYYNQTYGLPTEH